MPGLDRRKDLSERRQITAQIMPIVPVVIDGTYRVWPRGSARIHPAKVKVRFGEPICAEAAPETDKEASYQEIKNRLKERIQRMLDEIRD
jgi:1-acyl-sn-glycerol-3-phosphate acyltransferase